MFLSTMSVMEGTDPRKKLEKSYKSVIVKNWSVWPVVQFVNFKFVPLDHRVLLVNVISLGEYLLQGLGCRDDADACIRMELLPQLHQQLLNVFRIGTSSDYMKLALGIGDRVSWFRNGCIVVRALLLEG